MRAVNRYTFEIQAHTDIQTCIKVIKEQNLIFFIFYKNLLDIFCITRHKKMLAF